MYDAIIEFPRMKVAITTKGDLLTGIKYLHPSTPAKQPANALAERAARQIEQYRADPDMHFDLPMVIEGTELQKGVWRAMCSIPRGKTRTYGEIARELGGDARDVGQACGDNRFPIVIPCHRIVAANGLGGFGHATSGFMLEAKRWLLAHECGADAFELTP